MFVLFVWSLLLFLSPFSSVSAPLLVVHRVGCRGLLHAANVHIVLYSCSPFSPRVSSGSWSCWCFVAGSTRISCFVHVSPDLAALNGANLRFSLVRLNRFMVFFKIYF